MTTRRGLLILALGAVGAVAAFGWVYLARMTTARELLRSPQPELAWLRHEFRLDDAEFRRIARLHSGYVSQCQKRCRDIAELNDRLAAALGAATQFTPELEQLLRERAQVRATCQAEMLKHFIEVSQMMSPDQGRRYLAWVCENTCLREPAMDHSMSIDSQVEPPTPAQRP